MLKMRFAPSPTGLLHLGNIYSVIQCEAWALAHQGNLLLRIEDIDFTRCSQIFAKQMIDDLHWMGFKFDGDAVYQSKRLHLYNDALSKLIDMGVLYPCFCTRKEVKEQIFGLQLTKFDPYPRTCLHLNKGEVTRRMKNEPYAWRLNSQKIEAMLSNTLSWVDGDNHKHPFYVADVGDVVIGRKDIIYSYHLAVVVDDAAQDISHVVRGEDLQTSTPVHRILQLLLGYKSPLYIHHPLLLDQQGVRLAKIKNSVSLKTLRDVGLTAEAVRQRINECSTG